MCREDGEHTPVCIALNLDEAEHTIDLNQCGYTVLSAVLNTSDAYAEVKDGILKLPAYTIAVLTK